MWIVPASDLSHAELTLLGNNLRPAQGRGRGRQSPGRRGAADRRILAAVNRSLAALREGVGRLYPRAQEVAAGGEGGVTVTAGVPASPRVHVS